MKKIVGSLAVMAALLGTTAAQAAATPEKVLDTYANIAEASYADSVISAKILQAAVEKLIAEPTEGNLIAARAAWIAAREPYQQTEAYRFGNVVVDEFEGKVNAWPLDEGLIDYVDPTYGTGSDENAFYAADVIANPILEKSGVRIDATRITRDLLTGTLHEVDGIEANVATGYHAIEFLLWGQDLNGTGPGAGNRPASDFDVNNCTNGNCDRRGQYLSTVTDLMVDDLEWITAQWSQGGAARAALTEGGVDGGLTAMLTGLGSLSYGELAGERMKLGLMLHDPEEEHDCFSDNTHNAHYFDNRGMMNVVFGQYRRIDGSVVSGESLIDLLEVRGAGDVAAELSADIKATDAVMRAMVARAETVEAYDQMIGAGNAEGNAVVQAAIDGLTQQTRSIERAVAALKLKGIAFEGSDSLDNPNAVFQ